MRREQRAAGSAAESGHDSRSADAQRPHVLPLRRPRIDQRERRIGQERPGGEKDGAGARAAGHEIHVARAQARRASAGPGPGHAVIISTANDPLSSVPMTRP